MGFLPSGFMIKILYILLIPPTLITRLMQLILLIWSASYYLVRQHVKFLTAHSIPSFYNFLPLILFLEEIRLIKKKTNDFLNTILDSKETTQILHIKVNYFQTDRILTFNTQMGQHCPIKYTSFSSEREKHCPAVGIYTKPHSCHCNNQEFKRLYFKY